MASAVQPASYETAMVPNYATKNKWVAFVPLSLTNSGRKDVELKLADFTVPEIEISKSTTSFKGYTMTVPNGIAQAETKQLTFSYLVDSDWANYKALYGWTDACANATQTLGSYSVSASTGTAPTQYRLTIRVFLLSEFKKKVVTFEYYNCWLTAFGELQLSDQDQPDVVKHSFTVDYTHFKII